MCHRDFPGPSSQENHLYTAINTPPLIHNKRNRKERRRKKERTHTLSRFILGKLPSNIIKLRPITELLQSLLLLRMFLALN